MLSLNMVVEFFTKVIFTAVNITCFLYIEYKIEKPVIDKRALLINSINLVLLTLIVCGIELVSEITIPFLTLIFACVYLKKCYKMKVSKSILNIVVYNAFSLGIMAIVVSIIYPLIERNVQLLNSDIYDLQIQMMSASMIIFIASMFKFIDLKEFKLNPSEYIIAASPMIINLVNIMFVFIIFAKNKVLNHKMFMIFFVIYMLMTAANIFLISVITNMIVKNSKLKYEGLIVEEKIDSRYKYYNTLKENQEKVRKLSHDINNHIMCMESMDSEEREKYKKKIYEELDYNRNRINSGSIILDIILSEKYKECKKYGINFKYDIEFNVLKDMESVDICSIFSNILDNAVEACQKVEPGNRFITIKGKIAKNYFVIKAENSKVGEIKKDEKGNLETSKEDKTRHGLGTKIVEEPVEKYGGNIEYYDEEDRFRVVILIPIEKFVQLEH